MFCSDMEGDNLIALDGDNKNESPQVVSRRVIDGDYILKKNTKGSRAWEQCMILQMTLRCLEWLVAVCVRCVSFIKER